MGKKAAITILRDREEVERRWQSGDHRPEGTATFSKAPGDRGTEIHVDLDSAPDSRAEVMDALRRFKQVVETGEIPRSDGVPEGESVDRKRKPRPAQPLSDAEREKAGV